MNFFLKFSLPYRFYIDIFNLQVLMLSLKKTFNPLLMASIQDIYTTFPTADKQITLPMEFGWLEDEVPKLALFPSNSGAVFVDFLAGKKNHRRKFGGGKNQPLARAVGIKAAVLPTILDATAGMGGDAFVFATLGCKVIMLERSSVVSALLKDALIRANKFAKGDVLNAIKNLSLINEDSASFLLNSKLKNSRPHVDTIYMDPMYPEKKKKAATKKEMAALQNLLGADLDSSNLLNMALKVARLRVVVKRPINAPNIELTSGVKPTICIKSPNTRYDIYLLKTISQ